jgi:glycosyltransferase 2 family protein
VAVNVRFLQRFGVPPAAAVSAGAIDSFAGFLVQILLFLVLLGASDAKVSFSADLSGSAGFLTIIVIGIAVAIVVAVVVLALVPRWRAAVIGALHHAAGALQVLRNPTKLAQLFLGNLVSQVLFAIALGACVHAFGAHASLADLILINTVVSLFAGLLPVPGGIGVSEAGLTLGLTSIGIGNETAFAIALAYRFASFYLPPLWGYVCYRRLIARRFL